MFQAIIRQMSVPLRKLCIEDEGALLKSVIVNPLFHQLGGKKGKFRFAAMRWTSPKRELLLGYEDGRKEKVNVPEAEHEIEVGRLYGVEFLEDGWCKLGTPFDLVSEPIEMGDWLRMKALQVNSVQYTVRDAIKLISDYEGAHSNNLPALIAIGVNAEDIDRGRNMKYRLANAVHFGCLSYLQVIALFAGLYVIERMRELLVRNDANLNGVDVTVLAKLIRGVNTNFSGRAKMTRNCHEMVVAGKSNADPKIPTRRPAYRVWSGSKQWDAAGV